ncbi:hypothetical protein EI555_009236, partial [Monodon monoceros]
ETTATTVQDNILYSRTHRYLRTNVTKISKRDVIDVHSHVLMVTVGIDLAQPTAMMLARLATSYEGYARRGCDIQARGHKLNKTLKLISCAPLWTQKIFLFNGKVPSFTSDTISGELQQHPGHASCRHNITDKPVFETDAKSS